MNIDFLNANAPIVTTSNFDYNSFYRAVVMSTEDPEHLGRIKVKIPALHSNTNNYPYAYPAIQSGLGYQTGQYILPPVGSIVLVGFEYGPEHRILFFGGLPTKYAEGKTQFYGQSVNNGASRTVEGDDIPKEYTGSQAIIYKAPSGAILYVDSSTEDQKVYLGNINNQALILDSTTDSNDFSVINMVKLQYNNDSYILFDHNDSTDEDEFHLFLNGEEVDIGGGGGTGDYQELINKPKINSVTLNGNVSLQTLGIYDATLTFTRGGQTIGTFSSNSSTNTTINIPDDVNLEFLTKSEIDDIYNSL